MIFALAVARHWGICRALGKEEAGAVCSGLSVTCCLLKNANTPVCSGVASCCGHGLYLPAFTTTITCMLEQLVLLSMWCMLGTLLNRNCHCYFPSLQLLTQVRFTQSIGGRLVGRIWPGGWWFSLRGDRDEQLWQQVTPVLLCYLSSVHSCHPP